MRKQALLPEVGHLAWHVLTFPATWSLLKPQDWGKIDCNPIGEPLKINLLCKLIRSSVANYVALCLCDWK